MHYSEMTKEISSHIVFSCAVLVSITLSDENIKYSKSISNNVQLRVKSLKNSNFLLNRSQTSTQLKNTLSRPLLLAVSNFISQYFHHKTEKKPSQFQKLAVVKELSDQFLLLFEYCLGEHYVLSMIGLLFEHFCW